MPTERVLLTPQEPPGPSMLSTGCEGYNSLNLLLVYPNMPVYPSSKDPGNPSKKSKDKGKPHY